MVYRPEALAQLARVSQELEKARPIASLGKQYRAKMAPLIKNLEDMDRIAKSTERLRNQLAVVGLEKLNRPPIIFRQPTHRPLPLTPLRRSASSDDIAGLRDAVVVQTQVLRGLYEAGQAQAERSDARDRWMIALTVAGVALALVTVIGLFLNGS